MIKRVSLVWKLPTLSRDEFAALWLGEHAKQARALAGLREYVVDLVESPVDGLPDGIAVLRFDSREACDAAFSDAELVDELMRTRAQFAARAEVFFVEERVLVRKPVTA